MKRITSYLIAVALMAFTFTSCEDVPSPFGTVVAPKSETAVTIDPAGSGTVADPYNVAATQNLISTLGADISSETIYVRGYISDLGDGVSTQYWNAQFYISDTQDGSSGQLLVYRTNYLDNQPFTSADQIKAGDEVVMCGKVVNYKGNTPEFTTGTYIYSINGKGGSGGNDTPSTDTYGTKDAPITIAKALEYINALADNASTDAEAYVAGKITQIKTTDENIAKYKNIDYVISDGTNELTVFRDKNIDNTDFTAAGQINVGDEVVVLGKLTKYVNNGNTTPEIAQGNYIVKLTKGTGETPSAGSGDGTASSPYTVTAAIAKGTQDNAYVKAYIVGFIEGQAYESGVKFSSASTTQTNILIAASPDETNPANCMPVQLPTGDIRAKLNLQDNPGNYKKEVVLYGNITKYFGVPGLKNTSYAVIDGTTIGTNPGGGTTPAPTGDVKTVTIAEFNAAAESNDVWYQLTGTVTNLKDGDQYGNFDLVDETGSVYVYGVLSEKGGAKKLFQELVAAKGIKEGSKITIIGNRGSYQKKIEVTNAYFVSVQ
ncbi:MAG: hypothetical protein IJ637_00625 [Prevotella sp.]|nr:hypothetical protein [Prevotella sp.]